MKKVFFLRNSERATVRIRTENLLIRNQLLYPFELWYHNRRMKDSNLQVVSDWLVSNQLQYHYGNTAYLAVCQTAINIKSKKVTAYNCQYLRKDTGLISTSLEMPCEN